MATPFTAPEFRRARTYLRWLTLGLLLLGLAGAWIGLAAIREPETTWLDLGIAELQIMAGNWQPDTPQRLPPLLNIARVVVPLATTGLTFLLAVDLWSWLRSLTRRHTLVVGKGSAATALTDRLRRPEGARRPKRRVLVSQEGDPDSLRVSGIRRAAAIVVCGDDSFDTATNLATTRTAMSLARRKDFGAHLLVGDPGVALVLRAWLFQRDNENRRRIRVFTVDEMAARHHVRQVPLDGQTRPHILVVGSSAFSRAVIVEFARRWSLDGDRAGTPLITVVAPDATQALKEIRQRWPFVARVCELRPLEQPAEEAMLSIAQRPYRSYFGHDDENQALRTALTAATRWRPGPGSLVIRLTRLATGINPRGLFDALGGALDLVAVYDAAARETLLADEPLLEFARSIHQSYVDDALGRGEMLRSRPSLVPWPELPDDVRQSNVTQAEAFPRTLAAIRCSVAPRTRFADAFFFRPGEVDALARSEHEHWVAGLQSTGWKRGTIRNDRRKVHPLLVPWAELSEDDRSRNRAIVRSRPLLFDRVLEWEGLQIVRLADDPNAAPAADSAPTWLTPEVIERLALRIHENFLQARLSEGGVMESRPAMRPWEALSEDLREANRAQARDIGSKVDLLQATVTQTPPVRPFSFGDGEVEMLARYEHDRWVSERSSAGWSYGERDDEARTHNLLLPWLYLTDAEQEVDREFIRAIPKLLEESGWYISRR